MGGAGGDQDTENTELMAIYTRENQSAEKVTQAGKYKKKTTVIMISTKVPVLPPISKASVCATKQQ